MSVGGGRGGGNVPCIPPPHQSLESYHNKRKFCRLAILACKVTLLLLPTCTILPFPKDLVDHCQQRGEQAAAEHIVTHTVERTIHRARLWATSMHWLPNMLCFTPLHKPSVDVSLKASMLDCTQSSTSGHAFTVQYRGCCHSLWPCHEIKSFVRASSFFFKIRENVYLWKLLLCTILLIVLNLLLPLSDSSTWGCFT